MKEIDWPVQGFGEDGEGFIVGELDGVAFDAAGLGGGQGEVGSREAEVAHRGERRREDKHRGSLPRVFPCLGRWGGRQCLSERHRG
jgi:hypothetical protein